MNLASQDVLFQLDRGAQLSLVNEAIGNHGEIYTREWIVRVILDMVGFNQNEDLATKTIVEPACGTGAFLLPIVARLSASLRAHGRPLSDAAHSIKAFDLRKSNVAVARKLVREVLVANQWDENEVNEIVCHWIIEGDFLLIEHDPDFADWVVGNPPYVRLEDIASDRLAVYRSICSTMGGRADLYVGFFEVGLKMLKRKGKLGFICADRWMKNQYGEKLRQLVNSSFSVDATILMHDVDAFEDEVSAYPAISIISRDVQRRSLIANATSHFSIADAEHLLTWAQQDQELRFKARHVSAAFLPTWFSGDLSWPWGSPERLALLEDLNERFFPLESADTGTRVGIGVATGRDHVYVVKSADIEQDRLLPLVMSGDTKLGIVNWSGYHLVNPWESDGSLVDLDTYPRLKEYFEANAGDLRKRNVAQRDQRRWYRTIDKVDALLSSQPKLLFPDMKMRTHPVLDKGNFYPHHNLYFVVSDTWDLRVLGGLLLSRVAEFFVDSYAVKMRGGTLRFQSQYLRRIRVPREEQISESDAISLKRAFDERNEDLATTTAMRIYGIAEIPE